MKRLVSITQLNLASIALMFVAWIPIGSLANSLSVITYHDVVAKPGQDTFAISRAALVAQMDYVKGNGYQPVSLAFLRKVQNKTARLPKKALLLTFDDGFLSYRDFVVPLLKIYGFPSVSSLVTGWLDGKNVPRDYRNRLMSWQQVKQLDPSPLVTFVSHTHNLHHGLLSNKQGNEGPAAVTRQFYPFYRSYESIGEYRQRIKYDLGVSVMRFVKELGKQPYAITWPYGRFNRIAVEEATKLGMLFQLTLEDGPTTIDRFPIINRIMLVKNPSLEAFINKLNYAYRYDNPMHFVEVNLQPFLGLAAREQEAMLGRLLDELQRRKVNMIIMSPFSNNHSLAFFANDQLEVGADILNRVIYQMRGRVPITKVFLNIPGRLSVKNIDRLYEDLASLSIFDAVIFDKKISKKIVGRIKRVMGQYRPNLKYGVRGLHKPDYAYDFVIQSINAATAPEKIKDVGPKLNRTPKRTYVYLKTRSRPNGRQLKTAIQSLQMSGIKHYGYQLDKRTYAAKKTMAIN